MGANISRWRQADKNNPPIKNGIAVISQLTRLKGSMKEKFTANQIIDALREKHGNLSAAARFLGCDRHTVARYINLYQAAIERAGSESILFVVYGGGKKAEELSKQRGWIWYQDQQSKYAGSKQHGKE